MAFDKAGRARGWQPALELVSRGGGGDLAAFS
jgi:hypothetical protein